MVSSAKEASPWERNTHTHQLLVVMTVRPSRSWYRMFRQPHQVGAVVRGEAPDLCEPVPEGDRFSHKLEEQSPQVDRSGVKPLYNEIGYVELSWSKMGQFLIPTSPYLHPYVMGVVSLQMSATPRPIRKQMEQSWSLENKTSWWLARRQSATPMPVYLQYSQALAKAGTTLVKRTSQLLDQLVEPSNRQPLIPTRSPFIIV